MLSATAVGESGNPMVGMGDPVSTRTSESGAGLSLYKANVGGVTGPSLDTSNCFPSLKVENPVARLKIDGSNAPPRGGANGGVI